MTDSQCVRNKMSQGSNSDQSSFSPDVNEELIQRGWSKQCVCTAHYRRQVQLVCVSLSSRSLSSGEFNIFCLRGRRTGMCVSNARMNKCSSMTFPHVKQEGVPRSTQLDAPNWRFDLTSHLHMSHSTAGSCMFHRMQRGGQSRA